MFQSYSAAFHQYVLWDENTESVTVTLSLAEFS